MKTNRPYVRVERNGAYWNLRWKDARTGRRLGRAIENSVGMSEREAKGHAQAWAAELAATPDYVPANEITLGMWCDLYLKSKADLAETSIAELESTVALLRERMGANRLLAAVTTDDAEDFRFYLRARKTRSRDPRPISLATVRKHLRNARAIFGKAVKARPQYIAYNPFELERTAVPKMEKTWPQVPAADFEKVLDAADPTHRRVLAIARYAGLRRGEILRLRWEDIDFKGRTIRVVVPLGVQEETTKHRNRLVPMVPKLATMLQDASQGRDPSELVIGPDCPYERLEERLRAICNAAGVVPWAKPLHTLRKNLQTEWCERYPDWAVSDWLGNSVIVARSHYVRATSDLFAKATETPTMTRDEEIAQLEARLAALKAAPAVESATEPATKTA